MTPPQTTAAGKPKREMQVLALGLPRTGTASMAEALSVLGYADVYHGIKAIHSPGDWAIFDRAADAAFPSLPSYTGRPFTRAQWDELFGPCEAVTDMAAPFAPQLIEAYPDAKVVLVIRDFDGWWRSYDGGVVGALWGPLAELSVSYIEPMVGSVAGPASRKIVLGHFGARTVDEARQKARATYDRHHAVIEQMVPREKLLVYRLGEGWEPLCAFLNKPVPDVEFPRLNDAAELKRVTNEVIKKNLMTAAKSGLRWVVGGGFIVAMAGWFGAKRAT